MASPVASQDDDFYLCSSHPSHVVALYCQTCEALICPRCITQGPSSSGVHRQHVYLDLSDAYDTKKEEFAKVVENFQDSTQSRKNDRVELMSSIQHLKLELLRKKTQAAKQTKSLRDVLNQYEHRYVRHLESIVGPAATRKETIHKEVDYEVVSRDGLLAGAECLQTLPQEKCIQFLRGQAQLEKEIVRLSSYSDLVPEDRLKELALLKCTSLSLHREKYMLRQTMECPQECPRVPRFIPSWSTVGISSATLVLKFSKKVPVQHFAVKSRPINSVRLTAVKNFKCTNDGKRHREKDTTEFKLKKFSLGRVSITLRDLRRRTTYKVEVTASNSAGQSSPAVCYFTTSQKAASSVSQIFFDVPKPPRFNCCRKTASCFVNLVLTLFIVSILAWALYGMHLSHELVYSKVLALFSCICDTIWHQNVTAFNRFYEKFCPQKVHVSVELSHGPVFHSDNSQLMSDDHVYNGAGKSRFHMWFDWVLMVISDVTKSLR